MVTWEETERLLRAPWQKGHLARSFLYEGRHPEGEPVLWRTYHNDPKYISVRLLDPQGRPIVEFTETPDLVKEAV